MNEPFCPMCDGHGIFMGTLGSLDHYRCRDCGWDWSEQTEPEEEPDCDDSDDGQALASAGFGTDEDYNGGNFMEDF